MSPADVVEIVEEGRQAFRRGRLSRAIALFERAVREYRAVSDPREDVPLFWLGQAQLAAGQREEALASTEALAEYGKRQTGERCLYIQGRAHGLAGKVHLDCGYSEAALASLRKARSFTEQLGERVEHIDVLVHLARAHRVRGESADALAVAMEAGEACRASGDQLYCADAAGEIASALLAQGQVGSIPPLLADLDDADPRELLMEGSKALDGGQWEKATSLLARATMKFIERGDPSVVMTVAGFAKAAIGGGNLVGAGSAAALLDELGRSTGIGKWIAEAHLLAAEARVRQGDYEQARAEVRTALAAAEGVPDDEGPERQPGRPRKMIIEECERLVAEIS